jgi:hypothetical protein
LKNTDWVLLPTARFNQVASDKALLCKLAHKDLLSEANDKNLLRELATEELLGELEIKDVFRLLVKMCFVNLPVEIIAVSFQVKIRSVRMLAYV